MLWPIPWIDGKAVGPMHPMDDVEEPALVRRQLGRQLRRLRLDARKTHADAETAGMGHRSTLWRIEAGRAKVRPSTVRALCWLYDVDTATTDALYSMACRAEQPGWWEEYRSDLPTWFTLYVELEAEARALSSYHPSVVHGLLQTPDYARALFASDLPQPSPDDIERQVEIRMARQRRCLDRTEPLQLSVVLGEAALRCPVGGAEVLRAQLAHLTGLAALDHVTVRVLPFSAGAHPALKGAFNVLDLASTDDPDVAYVEALDGARYLEKAADLARFRALFAAVSERAVSLEDVL